MQQLIISASLEAMQTLGTGHSERAYHEYIRSVLMRNGVEHESEVHIPICVDGKEIASCRADLVFDGYVVELKAIATIPDAATNQIKGYIRLLQDKQGRDVKGMLVNFNQRRDAIDILFVDLNNPVDVLHMYPGNYNPSSVVNTESLVPVTAATDDVTVMGMQSDDIKLFLSALVNSYTKLSIRADQLYNMFVLFSREHSVVFVLSGTMFGRTIKTFSGVYSKRTKAGFIYQLDMEELKACLIKHHQYDEKAIIVCAQSNHSVDVPGASHVVDGA